MHTTVKELWIRLVDVDNEMGDYNGQVRICERVIEMNKTNSWGWGCLGDRHRRNGNYDGAIQAYENAVYGSGVT